MPTKPSPEVLAVLADAARALALPLELLAPEAPDAADLPPPGMEWDTVDPHDLGALRLASAGPGERRRAGVFHTPPEVARLVAEEALPLAASGARAPVCLDPACGCGSLLIEAVRALHAGRAVPAGEAARSMRGCDRDVGAVLLARLALVLTVRRLGVAAAELAEVAGAVARHLTVREALTDPPAEPADCVLMNPPYVRAARTPEGRQSLRQAYGAAGAFDLHVPFVALALRCLRPGGAFGLLLTNKLLSADYARRLRLLLAEETTLRRLIDLEGCGGLGPGPLVDQVILSGVTQSPRAGHALTIVRPQCLRQVPERTAPMAVRRQADLLRERWPSVRASASEARIIRRMTQGSAQALGSLALVRGGLRGFDYREACARLVEGGGAPNARRVLTPGNLRAYRLPAEAPVRLAGREWRQPALADRPDVIGPALWELFGRRKLVVKGVAARPTAAWSEAPAALFVAVWGVWGDEELLWAALGLLNSRPSAWLHAQQLSTARIPRGSLRLPLAWLKGFPVPTQVGELPELARARHAATDPHEQAALQEQLDAAAARAYALTPADLALMARTAVGPVQA